VIGIGITRDVQRAGHAGEPSPGPLRSTVVIGVVVLTYAPAPGMLEACLASLHEPHGMPRDETVTVVLVDNGGVTGSLDGAVLDDVEVVRPTTNTGFAGGMNVGIRHLLARGARAVMILNDDVVVEPGWLAPLVAELDEPSVGAVQPKLLFDVEPPTINSLGVRLGADGAGTDIGMHQPDDPSDRAARDLDVFTGGAVLLRDRFLTDTGGFDERFFLYYEDVDLALRGHELGWRYRLAPASRVRHRGSATVATIGDRAAFLRERNRIWVLFRHRPWGDVRRGLWLALRRVRFTPRRAHLTALSGGLAAAPRLVRDRRRARPRQ
jgi:N-acetylglucosaminyl-diphospho-decaprenol L-rhamnosyltransferase